MELIAAATILGLCMYASAYLLSEKKKDSHYWLAILGEEEIQKIRAVVQDAFKENAYKIERRDPVEFSKNRFPDIKPEKRLKQR